MHCRGLRARCRFLLGGMDVADGSPARNGPPTVDFHRHRIEVVERAEGYLEFRCLPATWSYPRERPLQELLTAFYSQSHPGCDCLWPADHIPGARGWASPFRPRMKEVGFGG